MKSSVGRKIEQIWPRETSSTPAGPGDSPAAMEGLVAEIRKLSRATITAAASGAGGAVSESLWLRAGCVADESTSIPAVFLAILVLLATIFASFGLFAPRNATVVTVLLVCAMTVGSAVFLVLEMDRPLHGVIKVSPDPLRNAYERLNR